MSTSWGKRSWVLVALSGCAGLVVAWMSVGSIVGPSTVWENISEAFGGKEEVVVPQTCAELMELVSIECHGFVATAERGGAILRLQYRPAELIACMNSNDADSLLGLSEVEERRWSEEFVLEIPTATIDSVGKEVFLAYASTAMQGDLVEAMGLDTVRCSFLHMEAGSSLSRSQLVILGFDRLQDGRERTIMLRDTHGFFGGDLRFDFPKGAFSRYHDAVEASRNLVMQTPR